MGGLQVCSSPDVEPATTRLRENADAADVGWTSFYRGEYPRLASALFAYTGDSEVASELAQEAMARAWSQWSRIASFENPAAWTCRVAINLANSSFRRALIFRRIAAHPMRVEAPVEPDIGVRLAVRHAVASLPRRQREAVVLRFLLDLPVDEVARLMRCRPGTVTAMTVQALARLRTCAELTEHGEQS